MNATGNRYENHIVSRLLFSLLILCCVFSVKIVTAAPRRPLVVKNPLEGELVKKYPFVVYSEGDSAEQPPYIPAGWMGNYEVLDYEGNWKKQPHSGKTCIRIKCKRSSKWCGIVWQSPANDWGDVEGGYNLSAARRLTFWARGEQGGEKVEFKFGILRDNQAFPDTTGSKAKSVTLTKRWRKYSIPVAGDKRCIKTGFVFAIEKCGEGFTFYLDDIQYE